MSCFGHSCHISNIFIIIILVMVICHQGSLMLLPRLVKKAQMMVSIFSNIYVLFFLGGGDVGTLTACRSSQAGVEPVPQL